MRVALVHDDLVQWGGAERVLIALSGVFPQAPIFTSVYDDSNQLIASNFGNKKVITSFIQKIPGWKSFYKALLPLYPLAFESFDFSGFDLVISQTTRFAKSIITKPETKSVCYCHTPPRFLWNFSGESTISILSPYFSWLRYYDLISSQRVDVWWAGSKNAQSRIKKIYQKDSEVLYPFVDLKRFANVKTFDGGYLLVISRLISYKKVDLVIKTANKLKLPLKIIGTGPKKAELQSIAGPTVEFLGTLDEKSLALVIAGCKALVVAAEEDFGLTPLEAQALGKPVVAYAKGGTMETVIEGKTGYFFNNLTIEGLAEALLKLEKSGFDKKACIQQAACFAKEVFIHDIKMLIDSL